MATFDEFALFDVIGRAQRLGFVGDRPVAEAIAHSRAVVHALPPAAARVVDLGAGGGLPGFVIAHDRPDLSLTLVDRRTKRTDFLELMVRRHGLGDRVAVVADDVSNLVARCAAEPGRRFDAAVARGFGPPDETLSMMAGLVRPGGWCVVTEPPSGDRWPAALLSDVGVVRRASAPTVAVFEVVGPGEDPALHD